MRAMTLSVIVMLATAVPSLADHCTTTDGVTTCTATKGAVTATYDSTGSGTLTIAPSGR